VDRIEGIPELSSAGVLLPDEDGRNEGQPMVAVQARKELTADQLSALARRDRRRTIDHEDIQRRVGTVEDSP
jgi:hypothetical protein